MKKNLLSRVAGSAMLCWCAWGNVSFATTIDEPGIPLVIASDPDAPQTCSASEYWDFGGPDGDSIPGSNSFALGQVSGTFLLTANTMFEFTGEQRLWFLQTDSSPVPGVSTNLVSAQAIAPEPGAFPLSVAGLIAMGWAVRSRRLWKAARVP